MFALQLLLTGTLLASSVAAEEDDKSNATTTFELPAKETDLRIATFNTALSDHVGRVEYKLEEWLIDDAAGAHPEVALVAEVIQRTGCPDILSLNEFDHVWTNNTHWDKERTYAEVDAFQTKYLSVPRAEDVEPCLYPYVYVAPCNTGVQSGIDMNKDGIIGTADDAFAYGNFPGAFSMVFLSMYPIIEDEIRTFQYFLWKDMDGPYLPVYPLNDEENAGELYYNTTELDIIRLAAKSFWDIPLNVSGTGSGDEDDSEILHVLMSHPRPPAFADRNRMFNHDEIRFWADYVSGDGSGDYIYDDNEFVAAGSTTPENPSGGLKGERFVILGDQNADPCEGDAFDNAIHQLTEHPMIDTSVTPSSLGGPEYVTDGCQTDYKTAFFGLRADYTLPSKDGFELKRGQVVWPRTTDDLAYLNDASDHHLTYIDVDLVPTESATIDEDAISDFEGEEAIEAGVPEESNTSAATPVVGRAAIAAVITIMSAALLL